MGSSSSDEYHMLGNLTACIRAEGQHMVYDHMVYSHPSQNRNPGNGELPSGNST